MIETRLNIAFSDDGNVSADVEANVDDEIKLQAELVAFAYYATKTAAAPGGLGDGNVRLAVRFLNTRRGPRVFLQVKPHGRWAPVATFLRGLIKGHPQDDVFAQRLELTDALVNRLAAAGRITPSNELDIALACADVAWQTFPRETSRDSGDFRCSECGYTAPAARFGQRLWPVKGASIRRCPTCGNGLWSRRPGRVRRIPQDVWVSAEALREELSRTPNPVAEDDQEDASLLMELKTIFEENGWPYAEVLGLPVLLSDLGGPLGVWKFYAQVVDVQNVVLLFSVCPLRVPRERRGEASLFLTHANHGLVAGNFELDLEDGEIRYKTVLQLHEGRIDRPTLKRAVRANGLAMETYLPGIGAVITGASARSAFERCTNGH
jgi:predicted RNA-binding Zn-ribbon protein involved in translation (DUF1610 family)